MSIHSDESQKQDSCYEIIDPLQVDTTPKVAITTIEWYEERALELACYPTVHSSIVYPILGLAGETGEVCEKVKKIFRDKQGIFSKTDREELVKELGDVLWYITAIAFEIGSNLTQVAEGNIRKLSSRKDRDVLHGNGDNR